jgi:hypothetical protein
VNTAENNRLVGENTPDAISDTLGNPDDRESLSELLSDLQYWIVQSGEWTEDQFARYQHELQATAYHEAGHAVMAFHVGRKVYNIRLDIFREFGSFTGTVWTATPRSLFDAKRSPGQEGQTLRETMIFLGGPLAEGKYMGADKSNSADWLAHVDHVTWQTDVARNEGFALRMCRQEELPAYLAWQKVRVELILNEPSVWCQVKALAETLMINFLDGAGLMSGRVARRICRDALAEWERANPQRTPPPPIPSAAYVQSPGNVS